MKGRLMMETRAPLPILFKPHRTALIGNYDMSFESLLHKARESGLAQLLDCGTFNRFRWFRQEIMCIALHVPVRKYGGL